MNTNMSRKANASSDSLTWFKGVIMNKQQLTHIASRIAWWSVTALFIYAMYYVITHPTNNCMETNTQSCEDHFYRAG